MHSRIDRDASIVERLGSGGILRRVQPLAAVEHAGPAETGPHHRPPEASRLPHQAKLCQCASAATHSHCLCVRLLVGLQHDESGCRDGKFALGRIGFVFQKKPIRFQNLYRFFKIPCPCIGKTCPCPRACPCFGALPLFAVRSAPVCFCFCVVVIQILASP